jgi:hypothetical protein
MKIYLSFVTPGDCIVKKGQEGSKFSVVDVPKLPTCKFSNTR